MFISSGLRPFFISGMGDNTPDKLKEFVMFNLAIKWKVEREYLGRVHVLSREK